MPLYEYKCDSCGEVFEVMQKFADEPLTVHEVCGGAVRRVLSAPALQFKGSGWYVTDYARGNGSGNGASKPEKDDASKKAETAKSEPAKPAAPAKTDK